MDSHSPDFSFRLSGSNSQPARPSLSMKGTTQSSQRGPPSSVSTKATCSYPIPIPESKYSKAVKLYTHYRLTEGLAQRHGPATADPLLSPATAQSPASRSTRLYTPSVSTSNYDALTDISSLISFKEEEGSPSQGNASQDPIAYNGKRVKHRVRRPLTPTAKAKAALIRCLGSCSSCHERRVPCPLKHHDIDALEQGRQAKSQGQQNYTPQNPPQPSLSASQNISRSGTVRAISSGGALGQSDSLLGLGQNEELLQPFPMSHVDPLSFAGDPLAGIQAQGATEFVPGDMADGVEISPLFTVDAYSSLQDGQLVRLGVYRDYFVCQHLNGFCELPFDTPEELEEHFATSHFEFIRLNPSCHYECSKCNKWNNSPASRCPQCHAEGPLEVWVCGTFIRTRSGRRYPPDGQDPFGMDISSISPFLSSYNLPSPGSPSGPGHGGATGFNDGAAGTGGYNYQQHNTFFQAPSNRGYGFDNFGPPPSGGYQTRENRLMQCKGGTWDRPAPRPIHQRYKSLLLAIVLLISIVGVMGIRRWLAMKAQSFQPRTVLPAVGFLGVFSSFILGYTFLSAKHLVMNRGTYMGQCRPRRCPLHDLPTLSLDYKPMRTSIEVRGIRGT